MKNKSYLYEFIKYSSLNTLGMIGLSCYILADTYFISKGMGADGLAALNLAIPVYSFMHGCGLMIGMGGATKYSIGKSRNGTDDGVFSSAVIMAIFLAAVFMITGGLFSGKIAVALGAESSVYEMTEIYLRIILMFAPAFFANDLLICFTRNDGEPRLAMAAMLTGSISNVLLDYIFIFPLGMGITGAVLATGLAPVISIAVLSMHIIRRRNGFGLKKPQNMHRHIFSVFSLGFSSLVTEVSSGIVILIFNVILLGISGNIGVAAYGITANLSLVITAVYTGIAQGMQPVVSRAYGASDNKGAALVLHYSFAASFIVSVVSYSIIFFFAENIASAFNSGGNEMLQSIAVPGLKIYFTGVLFAGFNIMLSMYFAAVERAVPSQILSLLRGFVLISSAAYILSSLWGITGVWLSFPVAEAVSSIIGAALYIRYLRMIKK